MAPPARRQSPEWIVANSSRMQRALNDARRLGVSPPSVTIRIKGEYGAGKGVAARFLAYVANAPFVASNVATWPAELVESILFGHKRGAFSGAVSDHVGLFGQAKGGILFLDEIGDMPLTLQPKLLRALAEREYTPVGSSDVKRVMCRVVVATNKDLEKMVEKGTFRPELLSRFGLTLELPPLNERREDIPALIEVFAQRLSAEAAEAGLPRAWRLEVDAIAWLCTQDWTKGNLRALDDIVRRACIMVSGEVVSRADVVAAYQAEMQGTSSGDTPVVDAGPSPGQIAEALDQGEGFTRRQYEEAAQVSKSTATRHINELIETGVIEAKGSHKNTRYMFCDSFCDSFAIHESNRESNRESQTPSDDTPHTPPAKKSTLAPDPTPTPSPSHTTPSDSVDAVRSPADDPRPVVGSSPDTIDPPTPGEHEEDLHAD